RGPRPCTWRAAGCSIVRYASMWSGSRGGRMAGSSSSSTYPTPTRAAEISSSDPRSGARESPGEEARRMPATAKRILILHVRADAVLCTQFLPAEVFAFLRRRGAIPVPVYCAITDFAVHPIWVYPGIDRYFVASEFSAEQLRSTGVVAADRIEVTGVPIDPEFA